MKTRRQCLPTTILSLLAVDAMAVTSIALQADIQPTTYLCYSMGGAGYKLDLVTGKYVERLTMNTGHSPHSSAWTFWNNRLWSVGQLATWTDQVYLYHISPADFGDSKIVGGLGAWYIFTRLMDVDRTTGRYYAVLDTALYEVNPETGSPTIIGPIVGTTYPGVEAMGIDRSGVCHIVGGNSGLPTEFYSLDLKTATATKVAEILLPIGHCNDFAWDSTGAMWATLDSPLNSRSGIYKIDLVNQVATRMFEDTVFEGVNGGPKSLAFVTEPPSSSYCTGKLSSQGCRPTIGWQGFASPNATKGFKLWATDVPNDTAGVLLTSLAGPAAVPLFGGTLCLDSPVLWGPYVPTSSGSGTPYSNCTGRWELDFNQYMFHQGTYPPGVRVQAQWMGRDSGYPPGEAISLSNAVDFEIVP
jgi:hypothetical protein